MSNNKEDFKDSASVATVSGSASDAPELYTNLVSIHSSIYDIRFDFGRRKQVPPQDQQYDFSVFMSPQHAKEMLVVMIRILSEYEKQFGKIPCEFEVSAEIRSKDQKVETFVPITKIEGCQ